LPAIPPKITPALISLQGYKVIAADINIGGPIKELNCEAIKLDIASSDDIQAFKQKLGDQPIDLLLNVAGNFSPKKDRASFTTY
jgi:short-subunit dehydrogenase